MGCADLTKLIHRYFFDPSRADLEWRFEDPSSLSLFKGCGNGDVLTSAPFVVGGCVFNLELTPNGYGIYLKEGHLTMWLALAKLPAHVAKLPRCRAEAEFKVRCEETQYADRKLRSTSPPNHRNLPFGYSFRGDESVAFAKFKDLQSFTFHCSVDIKRLMARNEKGENVSLPI